LFSFPEELKQSVHAEAVVFHAALTLGRSYALTQSKAAANLLSVARYSAAHLFKTFSARRLVGRISTQEGQSTQKTECGAYRRL